MHWMFAQNFKRVRRSEQNGGRSVKKKKCQKYRVNCFSKPWLCDDEYLQPFLCKFFVCFLISCTIHWCSLLFPLSYVPFIVFVDFPFDVQGEFLCCKNKPIFRPQVEVLPSITRSPGAAECLFFAFRVMSNACLSSTCRNTCEHYWV